MTYKKVIEILKYVCYFVSFFMFIVGLLNSNTLTLDISVLLLWIGNVLFCIRKLKKRVFFFAFHVTFFTFLLGRTVANIINGKEDYFTFSNAILVHTKVCLFIALISLKVSYCFFENYKITFREKTVHSSRKMIYSGSKYNSIRMVSKYLLFFTFIFDVMVIVEKSIFVISNGYAEYYVSYASHLPYVVVKLGDAFHVALFVFLATMPSKKEAKLPLILYFIESVLSLGTGKRTNFVVPLIILILYFIIRNDINPGQKPWLTKKHVYLIAATIPFLLIFLLSVNTIRFTGSSSNGETGESLHKQIVGFFESTGFSVNVISYEKLYEKRIPDVIYSIGNTVEYLKENILTQLFFDFPVYKNQTIEKALYGTDFTQIITYLYSPTYYLLGRGFGSCYIAEAYHDFGYIGIVLWSSIYSALLYYVYNYKNKGILYIAMSLCMFKYVLIAPRNVASGFLTELVNLDIWLVVAVIYLGAFVCRNLKIVSGTRINNIAVQKQFK